VVLRPVTRPGIDEYASRHTTAERPAAAAVAAMTERDFERAFMLCGPVVARFLQMLVAAVRPRTVLDIGTFTGYSAISMAAALPPWGRVVTCEVDERHAAAARRHIAASPHADRIRLEVGPALDTIARLEDPLDLVFIDGEKTGYVAYLEAVVPRLSERGLVVADNTLCAGEVLDRDGADDRTRAICRFNDAVVADQRLSSVLLTVRDGVTLIRRA